MKAALKVKRKSIKSLFLCASLVLSLSNISYAQETEPFEQDSVQELVQEEEYRSTNKDEKKSFPENILDGSKSYKLKNVDYEILEEAPITTTEKLYSEKHSDPIDSKEAYTPPESIPSNGITMNLIKTEEEEIISQERYVQPVTARNIYEFGIRREKIPDTKTVTVINNHTGNPETLVLPLKEVIQEEGKWVPVKLNLVFKGYDSEYYQLDGEFIPYNDEKPAIKGYENAILKAAKADPTQYHIVDINWEGPSYDNNGLLERKAMADTERFVYGCTANYEGQIEHEEIKQKIYTSFYEGNKTIQTGKTEYLIRATAVYTPIPISILASASVPESKGSYLPVLLAPAGAGIFLFLVFFFKTRNVRLYCMTLDGTYKYIGRAFLKKKRDEYIIQIPASIQTRTETNQCMARLPEPFVKHHTGKILHFKIIYDGDGLQSKEIDEIGSDQTNIFFTI